MGDPLFEPATPAISDGPRCPSPLNNPMWPCRINARNAMSSHDISISTPYALAVHPAATVGAIVEAINQLVTNESRRFSLDASASVVLASEAAEAPPPNE
ncbi:MAG: hypothetical protein IIA00_09215 [Proteobacteria bacterium]|nr:hypothetical protein [Pseudomonadota bacterium]